MMAPPQCLQIKMGNCDTGKRWQGKREHNPTKRLKRGGGIGEPRGNK